MTGCANWVMRLPHRLSVTVGVISSICNAFDSKGFLLSVVEKTKESARMGFRIIMKLSVARTLSFFISTGKGWPYTERLLANL